MNIPNHIQLGSKSASSITYQYQPHEAAAAGCKASLPRQIAIAVLPVREVGMEIKGLSFDLRKPCIRCWR